MQKQIFEFMGRRIELWLHAAPDHMAAIIKANRMFYELDVLMKCREIYLPGTTVIDVGANIGNHAVFFGAMLGAQVYAFEPYPPSFELLEMNIAANRLEYRVVAKCAAVGAVAGAAAVIAGPATNLGMTRCDFGIGETPVVRLDSVRIDGPVGLLKIDVEGEELSVLRGAGGLLREWQPDVMIEAGDAAAFADAAAFLLDLGYVPRGRYAATPTYLFSAEDQRARLRRVLGA